jgi:ribonucleotide reductase beta subunit family protein with ferritin-like domain
MFTFWLSEEIRMLLDSEQFFTLRKDRLDNDNERLVCKR